MVTWRSWLACWAYLVCASLSGCDSKSTHDTEVMLRIWMEPALREQLALLRVSVSLHERSGWRKPARAEVTRAALRSPVDIPITPRSSADAAQEFEVIVQAVANDRVLAEARALTGFVPGSWRVLPLWLGRCPDEPNQYCENADCRGEQCETCNAQGACVPVSFTSPETLPPLVGAMLDAGTLPDPALDGDAGDAMGGASDGAPSADDGAFHGDTEGAPNPIECPASCVPPNGSCAAGADSCTCSPGFSGPACATDACDPNPCPAGSTCARTGTLCVRTDQGRGDGQDVIILGDSSMFTDVGNGIGASLKRISATAYRNYATAGAEVLKEGIPVQYETARGVNASIMTVVMTGGLHDALAVASCADATFDNDPSCKMRLDEVVGRLGTLWSRMVDDQVRDVVMVAYSRRMRSQSKLAGYFYEKLVPLCTGVQLPTRCHLLDPDGLRAFPFGADGILPSAIGFDVIANAIWDLMQREGLRR